VWPVDLETSRQLRRGPVPAPVGSGAGASMPKSRSVPRSGVEIGSPWIAARRRVWFGRALTNLIQLNKLTQNTCLFIGISLTDPNMRRLLDVASRKNPGKRPFHYIIKRLPKFSEGDVLDEVSQLLEGQDANELGLNVIWIDTFDDLPTLLISIAEPED
jgi:hypothetical protein